MFAMQSTQTAIVTGASRGLGRGIAEALVARKMRVIGVARDAARLEAAAREIGCEAVAGDASDDALAGALLAEHEPDVLVLCAGASPPLRAIHLQTWESFSHNWHVDTKATFAWLRNALLLPMKPGAHVVVISSGAAVRGSPVSGGYASAKRAQWFIADYAREEVSRMKLDLHIQVLLPMLNPSTELGRAGIAAYAKRAGTTPEEYAKRFMPPVTPEVMGRGVCDLLDQPETYKDAAYMTRAKGSGPLARLACASRPSSCPARACSLPRLPARAARSNTPRPPP